MYILPFRNQGEFKTLDFLSYISYKRTRVGLVYFVYDKVFDPKYSLQDFFGVYNDQDKRMFPDNLDG